MKLSVTKSITGTLAFCLRHAVGFYLLGLLINLPSYLYSQMIATGDLGPAEARPWWEENIAVGALEALLVGFVMAVMVRTLIHDRRNEVWSLRPALAETFRRLPLVCGTALLFAILSDGGFLLSEFLARFSLFISLAGIVFVLWLAVVFSVAVPVAAAIEINPVIGVIDCMAQGAELTKGSRWRIVAILVLPALPFIAIAVGVALTIDDEFIVDEFPPLWELFIGAIFNVFFCALPVLIHEALVLLKEGPAPKSTASVFD